MGRSVRRDGAGAGRVSSQDKAAHLPQLVALLLQLLQGSATSLLVLREREHVAVEAGREDG